MVSIQKLHLEDCLEDTPQAKAMLDLFEKDTLMLKKFTKAFTSSCQKIANAQSMMISATQELSYYLRLYGKQDFPLDSSQVDDVPVLSQKQNQNTDEDTNETKKKENEEETNNNETSLASTLNQFANYLDEISTCFQVFVTQLNDSMIYPLNKLMDNEFEELNSLSQMYQISSEEEEFAIQRYLRLSTKKEHDLQRKQFGEEVFVAKKKFHQISMNYYSSLNALQHKRKYMLCEPMLSCIHNFKLFFKMGSETFDSSPNIDEFVNKTSMKICDVKTCLVEDITKTNQLIDLLQQDDSIYYIDQPVSEKLTNNVAISDSVFQKSGYLNLRSKIPFISKWDRAFYFIQNGFLMCMQKNEIAGYSFIEIKSDLTISVCSIDERVIYFQANSTRDRDEWIKILQNAVKEENRAKLLNYKNTQTFPGKASSSPRVSFDNTNKQEVEANINFELKQKIRTNKTPRRLLTKPQQGDTFKVRFLGSMNVKADKGNEYINDTIRQVMGSRAAHNIFKLSEFTLVVNSESINLFSIPPDAQPMTEDLIVAKFEINELAFWCSHKDNERLFGFIIKESDNSLKFICHVFESDVNSSLICDAVTQATQLAYQLLIQENRSEHFMKMKNREREILLQNIKNLPDKNGQSSKSGENESDEENKLLQNAASAAFNSPNPAFVVLDQETLDTYNLKQSNNEEEATEQLKEDDQVNGAESIEKSESEA